MAWKIRLAVLAAASLAMLSAHSQHSDSHTSSPDEKTTASSWKRGGRDGHWSRPGGSFDRHEGRDSDRDRDGRDGRDGRRDYNPEEFRRIMKAEVEKIPTLSKSMDRLMDIQAQRYTLQVERSKVATEQGERTVIVKRFHESLKKDMELTDESRRIMREIAGNFPTIQKEIDTRRNDLQQQIDSENAKGDAKTSSTAALELRRSQRSLDFLNRKLKELETRPERMDVLSRMLRGIPLEEFSGGPPGPGKPGDKPDKLDEKRPVEIRLDELQQRRRHLQRQLEDIEQDIKDLKDGKKTGAEKDEKK